MAHKTLVDSTEYEVTGGLTLVEGTSYSIKNGKVLVDGTEYDISFLLPPAVLNLWGNNYNPNQINCIAYANGYWVVGGQYRLGDTYCARIAYTTNLDGTWTTNDVWSAGNTYNTINCITYANGCWVVGGQSKASALGSYYARIAYATSLDGTWTTKNLWDTPSSGITCITYANGYWVVGGQYYDGSTYYARIAYTASPDGTWTTNDVWGYASPSSAGIANNIHCITYANGYWVAGGEYYASESHYARIAYAGSPTELGQTS